MNRYAVLGLVIFAAMLTYVGMKDYSTERTVTATYDQFDRLVSVQYGTAVRFDRDTEAGCQQLGAFKEALKKGFIAHVEKQVIQGPEGPDLCDQIALKNMMDEEIDRDRLEPGKVQAKGKSSPEAILPYIGEDEDDGIKKM